MPCTSRCICSILGIGGPPELVVTFMLNIDHCGEGNQGGMKSSADWHSDNGSCLCSGSTRVPLPDRVEPSATLLVAVGQAVHLFAQLHTVLSQNSWPLPPLPHLRERRGLWLGSVTALTAQFKDLTILNRQPAPCIAGRPTPLCLCLHLAQYVPWALPD